MDTMYIYYPIYAYSNIIVPRDYDRRFIRDYREGTTV